MGEILMKLINARTGEMECRICGATNYSPTKPLDGGLFYQRKWECRNGCHHEE